MLFTSLEFFALLLITFAVYYIPFLSRVQAGVLIVSSFLFYAYHVPALLLLLIVSILINAIASRVIEISSGLAARRIAAIMGVVFNLLILGFFKYNKLLAGLVVKDITQLDGPGAMLVALPLPIGISFYTFQGISLVVDQFRAVSADSPRIPRGDFKGHIQHTLRVGLFLSFFAQLIAGPIVKSRDFLPQIKRKFFRDIDWNDVVRFLVAGYFLKMVIADNLKDNTVWIQYPHLLQESSWDLIAMLFAYSTQIFADFAGYSLIALGLGALFQYRLPMNFNYPYISQSLSEFWTRWHISLSSFLRDYLYIPLGGNRVGKVRMYFNLILTMVLGGLWHGAAWSYAIWGLYHGMLLVVERPFLNKERPPGAIARPLRMIIVFLLVTFGWLFFVLNDIRHVHAYLMTVLENFHRPARLDNITLILLYMSPVFLMHIYHLCENNAVGRLTARLKPIIFAAMLLLIFTDAGETGAFIYFQF